MLVWIGCPFVVSVIRVVEVSIVTYVGSARAECTYSVTYLGGCGIQSARRWRGIFVFVNDGDDLAIDLEIGVLSLAELFFDRVLLVEPPSGHTHYIAAEVMERESGRNTTLTSRMP
jgi:hypothetical protein